MRVEIAGLGWAARPLRIAGTVEKLNPRMPGVGEARPATYVTRTSETGGARMTRRSDSVSAYGLRRAVLGCDPSPRTELESSHEV